MDASIIITTHNRHEGLKKLLNELCNQTVDKAKYEVIVVDSELGEDCTGLVNQAQLMGLKSRLLLTKNIISAKRNFGANNSIGRLLIFLDDDMEISDNFVQSHLNAHSQTNLIVSGGIHFPESWVAGSNYYRYKANWHQQAKLVKISDSHRFTSMNFSIFRDDFIRSGGFDESFIGYGGEDVEYGIRTARNGFLHFKSEEAKATHAEVVMSPSGFAKKLVNASMWTPKLISLAPESLSIKTIRFTEPKIKRNFNEWMIYLVVTLMAAMNIGTLLSRYLDKSDHLKFAYSPVLFKLQTLVCTKQGINQRKKF